MSRLGEEVLRIKAEHDDCRQVARESGLPLREVARRAEEAAWREVA
ncbi:MAG: nickel insertion protein [Methanothrix sp.]